VCGIVWLRGLFIGLRRVLETLVNLENSKFHLLVKLGDNHITNQNRIRLELGSYLVGVILALWRSELGKCYFKIICIILSYLSNAVGIT
jgi:hypothetical protein